MKKQEPVWLNIGSGVGLADPPFINVDNFFSLEDLKKGKGNKGSPYMNARIPKGVRFVKGDMCDLPFKDNYADYIECNDAIEHVGIYSVEKALREFLRVLKPGGKLAITTTNFNELARLWTAEVTDNLFKTQEDINKYMSLAHVIYGNQKGPGEYHRVPFNPVFMSYLLLSAGFNLKNLVISIYPTGCPDRMPQKAYAHQRESFKNTVILTEMMWIEVTK